MRMYSQNIVTVCTLNDNDSDGVYSVKLSEAAVQHDRTRIPAVHVLCGSISTNCSAIYSPCTYTVSPLQTKVH